MNSNNIIIYEELKKLIGGRIIVDDHEYLGGYSSNNTLSISYMIGGRNEYKNWLWQLQIQDGNVVIWPNSGFPDHPNCTKFAIADPECFAKIELYVNSLIGPP